MSLHIHRLDGCAPTPLAHYLKALAVLRLVSEQVDTGARGWWKDETFYLATSLDREALLHFFLYGYAPTPIVAPWNGGSGFFPKDNQDSLTVISKSRADRLSGYREALVFAGEQVKFLEESPKDDEKMKILQFFRRECSGQQFTWIEAALTIAADGSPAYPALLGTGGNDGRLDFTNNFMQRIAELFHCETDMAEPTAEAESLLLGALFDEPTAQLKKNAIGQFLPGGTGGANSTTGFEGSSLVNSWDFILTLEGALCFSSGLARRANSDKIPQAAAPFAVRSTTSGYSSSDSSDYSARGEQWFPLWSQPVSLSALRQMLTEGRANIGKKTSTRGIDFGRAIAGYGVARGISAFQRFAYLERNGQANLATPLCRWTVEKQPHQNLIDQVAPWVESIRRAGNGNNAPKSFGRAARNCEEAILACCRQGSPPFRWQDLLVSLGMAERTILASPKFSADPKKRLHPLPPLDPEWLAAMDDGSVELRLAAALASQYGVQDNGGKRLVWHDPIRRHFLPLSCDKQGRIFAEARFAMGNDSLLARPEVVAGGRDLLADATAILGRRLLVQGSSGFNLDGRYQTQLGDIAAFLSGLVNEKRLLTLAWPLTALRWGDPGLPRLARTGDQQQADGLFDLYGLLRLAHLPGGHIAFDTNELAIRCDPAILQRLLAGQPGRAITLAAQRLQASGLRPHLRQAIAGSLEARRLAASLVFPLRKQDYARLAKRLTRPELHSESLADLESSI